MRQGVTVQAATETQRKRKPAFRLLVVFLLPIVIVGGSWTILRLSSRNQPKTLAPEFTLTDIDNNMFSLSSFRGKIVVLDFMATWCSACNQQIPNLEKIWETYRGDIVIISIDIDLSESTERLRAFTQQYTNATWTWARDVANLVQTYQVTGMPKTVVIDQNGFVRFTHVGVTDSSTLIQEIAQLLD